jgi:hypothetical protein
MAPWVDPVTFEYLSMDSGTRAQTRAEYLQYLHNTRRRLLLGVAAEPGGRGAVAAIGLHSGRRWFSVGGVPRKKPGLSRLPFFGPSNCALVGVPVVASGTAHLTFIINARQAGATVHGVVDLATGGQARLLVTTRIHFAADGSIVFDHTRITLTPL